MNINMTQDSDTLQKAIITDRFGDARDRETTVFFQNNKLEFVDNRWVATFYVYLQMDAAGDEKFGSKVITEFHQEKITNKALIQVAGKYVLEYLAYYATLTLDQVREDKKEGKVPNVYKKSPTVAVWPN